MEEIWKDIIGYEGHYQVSNFGRIRGLDRYIKGNNEQPRKFQKGKMITLKRDPKGYLGVTLREKRIRIHRIVATTFIPNPDNLPEVNHLDGVKSNNFVENLEWSTKSNNMSHSFRTGLVKMRDMHGILNPNYWHGRKTAYKTETVNT
jgi:hypothetical protein